MNAPAGQASLLAQPAMEATPSPDALLGAAGFERFRPGQREAVEAALAGRDALVIMPTGGGKSLCYQLPGLATADLCLVVSPLIALMADQHGRLAAEGHPAVMLSSGQGEVEQRRALRAIRSGEARIAYASPERFASRAFREALEARRVDLFAVDEAHCISEWGHDFRPDYLRLPAAIAELGRPAVMACTATATPQTAAEIASRLGMREPLRVTSGFDRPNLSLDVIALDGRGAVARKLAHLVGGLRRPDCRPAIVYCGTRRDTEQVRDRLEAAGIEAVGYHAGMSAEERSAAQAAFMGGETDVVVATSAFGMGVDKADVRSVWHWAIPTSVEAYYQEAGRAGRDGHGARAVLLAMRGDLGRLISFNRRRERSVAQLEAYLGRLRERADGDVLEIAPPSDEDARIALAICERADAIAIAPAGGGRLRIEILGPLDRPAAAEACRAARNRGWETYRAIERFVAGEGACRRRQVLRHFDDGAEPEPTGRCCDACDPVDWLEPAADLEPRAGRSRSSARSRGAGAPAPEAPEVPEEVMARLRAWRLERAAGKPAYTVATDAALALVAAHRPGTDDELLALHGIGPAFVARHGAALRELLAELHA